VWWPQESKSQPPLQPPAKVWQNDHPTTDQPMQIGRQSHRARDRQNLHRWRPERSAQAPAGASSRVALMAQHWPPVAGHGLKSCSSERALRFLNWKSFQSLSEIFLPVSHWDLPSGQFESASALTAALYPTPSPIRKIPPIKNSPLDVYHLLTICPNHVNILRVAQVLSRMTA